MNVSVILSRGINCELSTPKLHTAATHSDFIEVIKDLKIQYPNKKIFGFGISLGANQLVNLMS